MNELHSHLCEQLLEGEMVAHLGDEKNDKAGDNSGNSRNGFIWQEVYVCL